MMVNICTVTIDNKGRIHLPKSFLESNCLVYGQPLTIKPMVNKKNSVALVWKEKDEETNE